MRAEFVRVILNQNSLLLPDLLYYGRYIITRKLLSAFQYSQDFIAPHSLIDAAISVKKPIVVFLLNLSSIGNEKAIIFEEMIDPKVRDLQQIGDTLCGKKTPHLIISSEDIPLREVFFHNFRSVVS